MSRDKKGKKAGRKALAAKVRAEQKARKRIRGVRAEIHEAMEAAAAMKRSKKKGTADVDRNMRQFGFERVPDREPIEQKHRKLNVEQKYRKLDGVERAEAAGRNWEAS